jgi:hypothetical protein
MIDIIVFDVGVGVEAVTTAWRAGNAVDGFVNTTNSPQKISDTRWQLQFTEADFASDSINMLGYEIEISVTDGAGNSVSDRRPVAGCLSGDIDGGRNISAEKWLGDNGRDSLWHLVSFPGNLTAYNVDTIFRLYSGLAPTTNVGGDTWRLYDYRNGGFNSLVTEDTDAAIEPGRGYWFRHIMALDSIRLDNTGGATTWLTMQPMEIVLDHGWNLIGSPFLFPVHINDTLVDRDSVSSFLRQAQPAEPGGSDWWEMFDIDLGMPQLEAWHGYAIWCENPGGYSIFLDPHYDPAAQPGNNTQSQVATIQVSSGDKIAGTIDMGFCPKSNQGPDITDVRMVGIFEKPSTLHIINDHGLFIRDLRPAGEMQVWRLYAANEGSQPMMFSWTVPEISDPGQKIILFDAVTGEVIDMVNQRDHQIKNPGQMPEGRFSILWGDQEAIKSALETTSGSRPTAFRLYQNYPNPFNPKTVISYDLPRDGRVAIEIFNILGQRVLTLIDKYQMSGSYQITWDGCDSHGRPVATGI